MWARALLALPRGGLRGQRQGMGLRRDLRCGPRGVSRLPDLLIPRDTVTQGVPIPESRACGQRDHQELPKNIPDQGGLAEAQAGREEGVRGYGDPLTIAQAPFGPSAILGVRRGQSVLGTLVPQSLLSYGCVCVWGGCCWNDTRGENWPSVGRGEHSYSAKRGPHRARRGRWEG